MPVVRELINRISFRVDKSSKKKVDYAFDQLKHAGVQSASIIKTNFKRAFAGITGGVVAGTFAIKDLETQSAKIDFFSKNRKEAEALLKLLDRTAETSRLISEREAKSTAATLSSFNVQLDTLKKFVPFLKQISIARPDLDFDVVAKTLGEVIKGGDLQALQNLIPGIKGDLELLSKTTFGKPFGDILEQQRAVLTLQTLVKNQERLNELAEKNRGTLSNTFQELEATGSDFISRFGKETALEIKNLLLEINKTIKLLHESEGFWNTVKSAVEALSSFVKSTRALFGDKEAFKEIGEKNRKEKEELSLKAKERRAAIFDFPGNILDSVSSDLGSSARRILLGRGGSVLNPVNRMPPPTVKSTPKSQETQKIEVSGETRVIVEGRNLQGADVKKIEEIANNVVNDRITNPMLNVIARNGGLVRNTP